VSRLVQLELYTQAHQILEQHELRLTTAEAEAQAKAEAAAAAAVAGDDPSQGLDATSAAVASSLGADRKRLQRLHVDSRCHRHYTYGPWAGAKPNASVGLLPRVMLNIKSISLSGTTQKLNTKLDFHNRSTHVYRRIIISRPLGLRNTRHHQHCLGEEQ